MRVLNYSSAVDSYRQTTTDRYSNEAAEPLVISSNRPQPAPSDGTQREVNAHLNAQSSVTAVEVSLSKSGKMRAEGTTNDAQAENNINGMDEARALLANIQNDILKDPAAAIQAQDGLKPDGVLGLLA